MGQMTDAGANQQLGSGIPNTVFIGLSSTTPTDAGTNVTEPVGNGYARISLTIGAAAARNRANTNAVQFAASGGDWGTMTHSVIYTALTGGTANGLSVENRDPCLSGHGKRPYPGPVRQGIRSG